MRYRRAPATASATSCSRYVQPGLVGLIDGTLSTLAPVFAAAVLVGFRAARLVGLATALGAGISMALSEALSDDGESTGRGHAAVRGAVTGLMTTFGGTLHALPFLIPDRTTAITVAGVVVAAELVTIALVRKPLPAGIAGGLVPAGGARRSGDRGRRGPARRFLTRLRHRPVRRAPLHSGP